MDHKTLSENRRDCLAENRRARFDYEILETIEAGIELRGFEVKSAKFGRMGIVGSYAVIRGGRPETAGRASPSSKAGEAWLLNSQIPPYQKNNTPESYDPLRTRRLLLRKEEISKLIGRLKEKSLSLIPLQVYLKRGFMKIELGLGRPRKKYDKRELLKKRSVEREMRKEK